MSSEDMQLLVAGEPLTCYRQLQISGEGSGY
jgi:hypothetical protein